MLVTASVRNRMYSAVVVARVLSCGCVSANRECFRVFSVAVPIAEAQTESTAYNFSWLPWHRCSWAV